MENGEYAPGSVWFYAPNQVAPAVFAFLFAVAGIGEVLQCSKHGAWRVTGLLPWCAALMVVGFTLREVGAFFDDNYGLWISSRVFLYVSLSYYSISNHVILARLLQYTPYYAPIHPGRSLSAMKPFGIIIITLFCSGGSQSTNYQHENAGQIASGVALMKSALILQLALVVFTVLAAARWQWSYNRGKGGDRGTKMLSAPASQGSMIGVPYDLNRVLYTLYLSCTLLICCAVFRIVEYFAYSSSLVATPTATTAAAWPAFDTGSVPPEVRYEWFFWVFDAVVLFCNVLLWGVMNPARDLPRDERTYLAEDGVERQGAAIEDSRQWFIKVLDPFDIWGLVGGYPERWWELGSEETGAGGRSGHVEE